MQLVEKILSLFSNSLSLIGDSVRTCTQKISVTNFSLLFILQHHKSSHFYSQYIWKVRAKFSTLKTVFSQNYLDHILWSIFAFKATPIFAQITDQKSPQKQLKNQPHFFQKNSFVFIQFFVAILIIWFAQISIANAQNNARALPTAGQVVAGTAVITQSGLQTQVNQSS